MAPLIGAMHLLFNSSITFPHMIKAPIYLILSIACCLAQAQSLQLEAFVSGGSNFSQGATATGFQQSLFPTFYAQGNLGYWFSDRLGAGAGLTYFPIGSRNHFSLEKLDGPSFGAISVSSEYAFMPHLYGWYAFSEDARMFPASQISIGLLYARRQERWGLWEGGPVTETALPDGQTLYSRFESLVEPHTFLAVEARWDVRLLQRSSHGLFAVLHVIKGLNPVMDIRHAYSIGNTSLDQQSDLVLRGDYLGIGVAYKWKAWRKRRV